MMDGARATSSAVELIPQPDGTFIEIYQVQPTDFEANDVENEEEEQAEEELSHSYHNLEQMQPVTDSELDDFSQLEIEPENQEITEKYLRGEITFTDYIDISEKLKEKSAAELGTPIPSSSESRTDSVIKMELLLEKEQKKMRAKKRKRQRGRLPRDLQGLMGEANLCFARGRHEEAIKMCMEIIRLVPTAPEPFQTLGMIYEEMGDMEKSLQASLIAAYLSPGDAEEWVKLAEMLLEQGNVKEAITCYSKAIKCEPNNDALIFDRSKCYEALGDQKKALEGYRQILGLLAPEDGVKFMQISKEITRILHESGDIEQAVETMETAFKKHPLVITAEEVNLLSELYISQKTFPQAIDILCKHCGVVIHDIGEENAVGGSSVGSVNTVSVPDALPIDLRIKLVVCLIHLRNYSVEKILVPLFQESPETMGDLYLDIAEAYMETGQYNAALPVLAALVDSKNYNLAAVWLRYGECLNSLGKITMAAKAYQKVVELAPSHLDARVTLSSLQQQLGHHDDALQTLAQADEHHSREPRDLNLLLQKCNLLYSQGKLDEFIHNSKIAFSGQFRDFFKEAHLSLIIKSRTSKHRKELIKQLTSCDSRISELSVFSSSSSANIEDLWELFRKVCDTLYELKRFGELEKLTISALTSPRFMEDPEINKELEIMCLMACYANKNFDFAYNIIKELCVKDIHNNQAWNMFCQIVTWWDSLRHNRFCMRLLMRQPDNLPLEMLNGHNSLAAGSYKHCLGEYVSAFRKAPKDPLISLCIGLTFIHMACQKFASQQHSLIVQGCSFLNQYAELRGECQETFYNLGRAMHQVGLYYAAVFYYKKVLEMKSAVEGEERTFDLRREAACNLSLIYQNSGSMDLARMIIQQHCIV